MSKRSLLVVMVGLVPGVVFAACAPQSNEPFLGDEDGETENPGDTAGGDDTGPGSGPSGPAGGGGESNGPAGPTSGGGGDPTSGAGGRGTTSGAGGDPSAGVGGGASSGQGGGAPMCHGLCEDGEMLDPSCDPCVAQICDPNVDPYCCDTAWDATCIDEVESVCGLDTCSAGSSGSSGSGGGGPGGILPGDLVITEVMNNPKAVLDSAGEWFEVKNVSPADVDLDGLVIRHDELDAAKVHTIVGSVIVPAGGYAVLGLNGDKATNGNVDVDYVYPAAVNLGNTADWLSIETAAPGTIIDFTTWNEASGLDPDGATRSLSPTTMSAGSNDDDTNFCAATTTIAGGSDEGTPGGANDACP